MSSIAGPAVTGRRPARVGPASLSSGPGPSGVRVRRAPLILRHQAVGEVVPGDKVQPAAPPLRLPKGADPARDRRQPMAWAFDPLVTGFRVGPTPKQLLPSASVVGLGAGARAVAPNPFRAGWPVPLLQRVPRAGWTAIGSARTFPDASSKATALRKRPAAANRRLDPHARRIRLRYGLQPPPGRA